MAKTFKIEMIITVEDKYFDRNGKRIEDEITSGVFAKDVFSDAKEIINTDITFELMEKE